MKTFTLLIFALFICPFIQINAQVTWTNLHNTAATSGQLTNVGLNGYDNGASSLEVLPADQDGYYEFTISTPDAKFLGVSHENPKGGGLNIDYVLSINTSSLDVYKREATSTLFSMTNAPSPSSSNIMTYKIERKGDEIEFSYREPGLLPVVVYTLVEPKIGDIKADVSIFRVGDFISNCDLVITGPSVSPSSPIWNHGVPNNSVAATRDGAVGIGVDNFPMNPLSKLYVLSHNLSPGSVLFEGDNGKTPQSGPGTRFMWVPKKKALRAGSVTGSQWNDNSIGYYSFATGEDNTALGQGSISAGYNNHSIGASSATFGSNNVAFGISSFVSGTNSTASEVGAFAAGNDCTANGNGTVAMGQQCYAYNSPIGTSAIALGTNCQARDEGAVALGYGAYSNARGAVALGSSSTWGQFSFAAGDNSLAQARNSVAIGSHSTAEETNSVAIGNHSVAESVNSVAIGYETNSNGENSFSLGHFVKTRADNSFVMGNGLSAGASLDNYIDNSLMIGFNSLNPTLFVGDNVNDYHPQYWGKVGIGTTAPRAFLDVNFAWGLEEGDYSHGDWNAMFDASMGCYDNVLIKMGDECGSTTALGVNNGTIRTTNIYADGHNWALGSWWSGSDRSYKSNIKEIKEPLEVIKKLNGKSYDFKGTPKSKKIPSYGFIAQEIKEIVPDLVRKFENDKFAVNYDGFIPILIEAIKEQQNQIESKDNQIQELKDELTDLANTVNQIKNDISIICDKGCDGLVNQNQGSNPSGINEIPASLQNAWLGQNYPNPNNNRTNIKYYIPSGAKNAEFRIVDLQGKLISTKSLDLNADNIELENSNLPNGLYLYSLVVDNVTIDSKKMVVER